MPATLSKSEGPVSVSRPSREEVVGIPVDTVERTRRRSRSTTRQASSQGKSQRAEIQGESTRQPDLNLNSAEPPTRGLPADPPVFPPATEDLGDENNRRNPSPQRNHRVRQYAVHAESSRTMADTAEPRPLRSRRSGNVPLQSPNADSAQNTLKKGSKHKEERDQHKIESTSTGRAHQGAKVRSMSNSRRTAGEDMSSSQHLDRTSASGRRTHQAQQGGISHDTSRRERRTSKASAVRQSSAPSNRHEQTIPQGGGTSNTIKATRTTRPSHAAIERAAHTGPSTPAHAASEALQNPYVIAPLMPMPDFDDLNNVNVSELSTTTDATDIAFERRKVAREKRNRAKQVPSPAHSEVDESVVSVDPERGRRR